MERVRDMVMRFSDRQRIAACRALLERAQGRGPNLAAVVVGAAKSICDCEVLTAERERKLAALQDLFGADPAVAAFLGVDRATLAADTGDRLERIDQELRARILAVADLTLSGAAEQIGVEIKSRVDRSKLTPAEVELFDAGDFAEFRAQVRAPVRARLTADEDIIVDAAVAKAAAEVGKILAEGTELTLAELDGFLESTAPIGEAHEADRPRAVELFVTAMTAMMLSRLDRATDGAERVLLDALTPEGVARETLEVAGGAASTDAGGVPRGQNGRPLTPAGEVSKGANLAQGHSVSDQIESELGLTPVAVFRHSGKRDPRDTHKAANGLRADQLPEGVFPGAGPDCGCSWATEYIDESAEVAA